MNTALEDIGYAVYGISSWAIIIYFCHTQWPRYRAAIVGNRYLIEVTKFFIYRILYRKMYRLDLIRSLSLIEFAKSPPPSRMCSIFNFNVWWIGMVVKENTPSYKNPGQTLFMNILISGMINKDLLDVMLCAIEYGHLHKQMEESIRFYQP